MQPCVWTGCAQAPDPRSPGTCAHIPLPPLGPPSLSAHRHQARVILGEVRLLPLTHPPPLPSCTRSLSASRALPAPSPCSLAGVRLPLSLLSLQHAPSPHFSFSLAPSSFLSFSCSLSIDRPGRISEASTYSAPSACHPSTAAQRPWCHYLPSPGATNSQLLPRPRALRS